MLIELDKNIMKAFGVESANGNIELMPVKGYGIIAESVACSG